MKQDEKKQKKLNKDELEELIKKYPPLDKEDISQEDIEKIKILMDKIDNHGKGYKFLEFLKAVIKCFLIMCLSGTIAYFFVMDRFSSSILHNAIYFGIYSFMYTLVSVLAKMFSKDSVTEICIRICAVGIGIGVSVALSNQSIFIHASGLSTIVTFLIIQSVISSVISIILLRIKLKRMFRL